MSSRRKAREIALQALYQAEMSGAEATDLTLLKESFEVAKKGIPYAQILVNGITEQREKIDAVIRQHAKNWRVDRMSIVDRNLLRIGIYELLFQEDVPSTVVINESIEIAKKYGTDDSASFINGILDAISDGPK